MSTLSSRIAFLPPGLRSRKAAIVGFSVFALALGASAAYSQQTRASQAAVVNAAAPTPQRMIHVKSERVSRKQTPQGLIFTLDGHAKIESDETTLVSDLLNYNQTSGVANSPGKLQIDDPQNTVIGNTGVAYYARRDAIITGNVHITARPKPDNASAPEGSTRREFKEPVNITCDNVDYNWRTRVAIATGHLVMKMNDSTGPTNERTVTADKATYYGKDEKVVLEGHVHYTRTNGERGDAPSAEAILTEGKESFDAGSFTGAFPPPPDEDDTTTPTGNAKPATGATPSPSKPGTPKSPDTPPATTPLTTPGTTPATSPTPAAPTTPVAPPPTTPVTTPANP